MKLGALLPDASPALADLEISGVTADSREARPGYLFVAIPGAKADGARYIGDALARGATAIVAPVGVIVAGAPIIHVADARAALSRIASRQFPRQPDTIVAVTGTSGKTSVADFARQIFTMRGRVAASLGTLGVVRADGAAYGSLTTPDPISLHRTLDQLAGEGVTHLAMEASSHGLDQKRLDEVRLRAAAFTNLGRDHLDYHPSIEDYLAAKLRLFQHLLPRDGVAVVNMDGERAADAAAAARARGAKLITVGRRGDDLTLRSATRIGFAQQLTIAHHGRARDIRFPLIGEFQVENALTAAALAIGAGEDADMALSSLSDLRGVPGRLEAVGETRGGVAIVDYSHKPDALAAALDAVRPFVTGKLIVVFGCGGDRDRGKRPLMGAIAQEKADLIIVTDDNPRSEDPAAIRREILAGAPGAREIGDRADAIQAAIAEIRAGDIVLVAGKGHETGQIVGDRTLPFSDHDVVLDALKDSQE